MSKKEIKTEKEKFQDLLNEINWENWIDDEDNTKYYDFFEVMYSKLNWLQEKLTFYQEQFKDDDLDEHLDTINQLKSLVELLSENKMNVILKQN